MRHLRQQIAEAADRGDEETRKRLRKELIAKELEVYKNRAERYPSNLAFKYDLYTPRDVELMIELFKGRTAHYVFASSTVIYAPADRLPIAEGHAIDRGPHQNRYGMNKLLCEDLLLREHRENGFPCSIVAFSMRSAYW